MLTAAPRFCVDGLPDVWPAAAAAGLRGAEPGLLRGRQLHSQTGLRPQKSENTDTQRPRREGRIQNSTDFNFDFLASEEVL